MDRNALEQQVRQIVSDTTGAPADYTLLFMSILIAIVGCLAAFGWPSYAVNGWDEVQSRVGWAPELPGM